MRIKVPIAGVRADEGGSGGASRGEVRMVRAYSIKVEDVAAERERVDQNLDQVDISRVVQLDELQLSEVGPRTPVARVIVRAVRRPSLS